MYEDVATRVNCMCVCGCKSEGRNVCSFRFCKLYYFCFINSRVIIFVVLIIVVLLAVEGFAALKSSDKFRHKMKDNINDKVSD